MLRACDKRLSPNKEALSPNPVPFSGEVGDRLESSITGRREFGILICNSDMGLTPMDLFNDILTNENDLRNFLQQSDVKNVSSSSPDIIIQGNTFTKHADNHL